MPSYLSAQEFYSAPGECSSFVTYVPAAPPPCETRQVVTCVPQFCFPTTVATTPQTTQQTICSQPSNDPGHYPQAGLGQGSVQPQPPAQTWTDVTLVNKHPKDIVYCLKYVVDGNQRSSPCYWIRGSTTVTITIPGFVQYNEVGPNKRHRSEILITAIDPYTRKEQDLGYGQLESSYPARNGRLPVVVELQLKN